MTLIRTGLVTILAGGLSTLAVHVMLYNTSTGPHFSDYVLGIGLSAILSLLAYGLFRLRVRALAAYLLLIFIAAALPIAPFTYVDPAEAVLMMKAGLIAGLVFTSCDLPARFLIPSDGRMRRVDGVVLAAFAIATGGWALAEIPLVVGRAKQADCALMIQALGDQYPGARRYPTVIDGDPACDWRAAGFLNVPMAARGTEEFLNQAIVYAELPRYSLLGTKAVVGVGSSFGMMVGGGEDCVYRRGLRRWRQVKCRETWIS